MSDRPIVRPDRQFALVVGSVEPRQRGLGIEGVDVAGRAIHEQEYAVFRLGGEMLRLGCERAGSSGPQVAGQQIHQRQRAESTAKLTKKFTSSGWGRRFACQTSQANRLRHLVIVNRHRQTRSG